MTRRITHLCVTGTFSGCMLLVSSSCSVLHTKALQAPPSRGDDAASRQRLAQMSFGRQAAFAVCAEPACPQVTAKTLAIPKPEALSQPVTLRESPPPSPVVPVGMTPAPPLVDPVAPTPSLTRSMSGAISDAPAHRVVVTFPFASSVLTPSAKASLSASIRHAEASETIAISGRTDAVGDPQVNDALALSRALAVRDFLRHLAPETAAAISIDAKGRCCFIASNADEQGRARNRRVQVVFHGPRGAS